MDMPNIITRTTCYGGALALLLLALVFLFFAPESGPTARFLEGAALWLLVGGGGLIAVGELLTSRISRAGACERETPAEVQGGVAADAPLVVGIDRAVEDGDRSVAVVRRGGVITDALVLPPNWSVVPSDPWGPNPGRTELRDAGQRIMGWLRPSDGRWVDVDGETLLSEWLGNLPPRGPGGGEAIPKLREGEAYDLVNGGIVNESAIPGAEGAASAPELTQEARSGPSAAMSMHVAAPLMSPGAEAGIPTKAERARLRDDAFSRIRSEHWAETADRVLDESRALLTDVQRALLEGARDRTLTRETVRAQVERVENALAHHCDPGMAQLPHDAMENPTTARAIYAVGGMRIEAVKAVRALGAVACELAGELERVRGVAVSQIAMATSARRALSLEVIGVEGALPDDAEVQLDSEGNVIPHRPLVYTTRGGELREVPVGQLTGYSDGESGNYVPPQREELRVLGKAFVLDQLLALGWVKEAPSGYYWPIFDEEPQA